MAPVSIECSWTHVRFPSNAITVLVTDFWNTRCWFTVLVNSWRSARGREGKDWGVGMGNWACYSKSSVWLLPNCSAMHHCGSFISCLHTLCFAYCGVLLGTRAVVVCAVPNALWHTLPAHSSWAGNSKAWGALALELATDPLGSTGALRWGLFAKREIYTRSQCDTCVATSFGSTVFSLQGAAIGPVRPCLRQGSPGCSTALASPVTTSRGHWELLSFPPLFNSHSGLVRLMNYILQTGFFCRLIHVSWGGSGGAGGSLVAVPTGAHGACPALPGAALPGLGSWRMGLPCWWKSAHPSSLVCLRSSCTSSVPVFLNSQLPV